MADEANPDGRADKRREHRQRVLKSGRIVFNGGYTAFDCRVKNLSSGGALLQMPSMLGIPNQFQIEIDKSNRLRPCTVTWRTDTLMGVAFDDVPAATAPADPRPHLRLVEPAAGEVGRDHPAPAPGLKSA